MIAILICHFTANLTNENEVDTSVRHVVADALNVPKSKQPSKNFNTMQIRYCSVQCQRKDWDFHRFACAVVAKKSDTVKA